jgi:hypothetical protein
MKDLRRFDHWDVHKSCPGCVSSEVETRRLNFRTPDRRHLQGWAKLRLVKGLRDSKLDEASAEVRDLARLLMSTESAINVGTALRIHRFEREAIDHAYRVGMRLPEYLQPLSVEVLEVYKRACSAALAMFQATRSSVAISTIYARKQPVLCRCTGIAEGMLFAAAAGQDLRRLAAPQQDRVMNEIIRNDRQCRLTPIRKMWSSKAPLVPVKLQDSLDLFDLPRRYQKLFARILVSMSDPDPWKYYRSVQK